MKKQFLWVVILPLLILSCATPSAGHIFDESVPLEESAWINTIYLGKITAYNGITVEWKKGSNIQIPAGDTLLEADVDSAPGNTRYIGKGMIFQYNFQAGRQYYFFAAKDDETDDIGVSIHAWDLGTWERFSDETREAFVPFLNAKGNTGVGG